MTVWFDYSLRKDCITQKFEKTPFRSYAACVEYYNERSLSYDSDIYKAFTGILGRLYTSVEECTCGIPEKDFDAAILWEIDYPDYSTRKRLRIIQNIALPTWAWASLTRFVEFKEILGAVATWQRIDEREQTKQIIATDDSSRAWKISDTPGLETEIQGHYDVNGTADVDPRQYVLAAWPSCIEAPLPQSQQLGEPFACTRIEPYERWPSYEDFWREAHQNQDFHMSEALTRLLAQEPGRIAVQTSLVNLQLFRKPWPKWNPGDAFVDFYLLDSEGWCVGTCRIPELSVATEVRMTRSGAGAGTICVIALSVAAAHDFFVEDLKRREVDLDDEKTPCKVRYLSLTLMSSCC